MIFKTRHKVGERLKDKGTGAIISEIILDKKEVYLTNTLFAGLSLFVVGQTAEWCMTDSFSWKKLYGQEKE